MEQQFYQPHRRKRQEDSADDQGGIYPSFYTGAEGKSTDPTETLSNIDDVLAQNDAVRASIPTNDDLRNSEESASPVPAGAGAVGGSNEELDKLGKGFRSESGAGSNGKPNGLVRKIALNRRNKLLAGGGLGGLLLGIILSAFFALPLKVQHIANNLQQEFFASAEQATEDMTDALMRSYIVKYLAPGMVKNNCTSTRVNKSCVNTSTSSNIVGVLYNGWRDAKIENKLADKGIVIEREGGRFFLTTPSGTADLGTLNPDNPDAFNKSARRELSRTEVRKQMKIALKDETLWNRAMYRYKVGGLLERKYGVQRCIVACQTRDKWADTKDEYKKRVARSLITQRVLNPLSEFSSLAMECAIGGFQCTQEGDVDENGERLSQIEADYRARLADYRTKYPDVDIADLDREAEELRSKGMIEHMLSKVIGKTATKLIPILGWIDLGAQLMAGAATVGPAAVKFTYVANSTAAVNAYMLLRTNADEIKTGKIDATMTGSVATALSETDGFERTDQNGVGAEGSPLYSALMGSTTTRTRSASASATAYAASSRVYGCEDNDNKPVPRGQFVCPVERLDAVTAVGSVFNKISDIANMPMMKPGVIFSQIWTKISALPSAAIGPIVNAFMDALPGDPQQKLADLAKPIVETFMSYIVKPIIGPASSGARLFNLMATGADVAGNDFTHYGLGAASVDYKQAHDIRVAREQERYEEFQSRSMFARMFSTDTDYSLVSKAAMATPLSTSGNISPSFMSVLSNPVKAFTSGFAAITAAPTASAKVAMTQDHAGVTQYAYDPNDPIFDSDPEAKYDELDCDNVEVTKNWGNKAQNNANTEMLDHKPGDTNPCLLIRSAAGSAGVRYTDEVLTDEERAELNGTVTTGGLGGDFTVASFNILGASHTDDPSDHKPNKDWKARLDVTIKTIQDNNLEIIGFQEFQSKQRDRFLEKMGSSWAITKPGDHQLTANAIGWDTTKFERVTEEKIMPNLLYFNNSKLAAPYVKLKYKLTGQDLYVLNTHDPANTRRSGCDCASERLHNANQHVALINSLKSQGLPIVFTGDFNSGYGSSPSGNGSTVGDLDANATYCVLTRGGTVDDAYDLFKKRAVKCPNPIEKEDRANSANGIDHIFVTNGVSVTDFRRLAGGYTNNGSDHPTVVASVSMPGSDTGGAETGAVKMRDDYKTECGPMRAGGSPGLACDGQCVDFVKFRLKKHISKSSFASLGNGKDVVGTLGAAPYNYKVNNTPAVNAVASWPAGGVAGNPANSTYGHTAMVSRVNPDNSIVVEEYNATIPAYSYGSRTIPAAAAKLLKYAHTEVDFK